MKKLLLPILSAALAACGTLRKAAQPPELDLYLEQFEAVKLEGTNLYLRAAAISEEKGGEKRDERRRAFEARLQALRIIDAYNRVLVGMARGEDPKALKSGMKTVGSKLSAYHASARTTFAFASAVPYVGAVMAGAGMVQEALAKRRFKAAARAASEPIGAILDLLQLDSEPLETLIVEQARLEQDGPRAAVDSLSGRFYKRLTTLRPTPELGDLLDAHNAHRQRAGLGLVPRPDTPGGAAPRSDDLEYLAGLTDQAALNLDAYRRSEARVAAETAFFARYRAALKAGKAALAALCRDSEPERVAATGEFNAQALAVRQQGVKLREANR